MKKWGYDAYFEELYDGFIDKTYTEEFGSENTEKLETFLRETARYFYEKGRSAINS